MERSRKPSTTRKAKAGASQGERPFTYRGITIHPFPGKRSPLAEAIREGFRTMNDTSRDPTSEG